MRFDDRAIARLRWLAREPVAAPGLVAGAIIAERYRIVRQTGEGGMGAVFEAEDAVTGRAVALKVPHPRFCNDPAFRKRFLREARAASALSHPNVIEILDVVVDAEQRPMIVMELLVGKSLAQLLRERSRLTVAEAASLLVPVLDALDAAHARGVIHRDLKPENVFLALDEGGCTVPKLLDFGIAKVAAGAEGGDATGTITGTMLGTPSYMAPEQVTGVRDVDQKVDVWAAGAVLYECLAGRRAFAGDNFAQIFTAIREGKPSALRELAPEVPESIEAAVSAALTRDRDQRPSLAAGLREVLAPFVDEGVLRPLAPRAGIEAGST